MGRDRKIRTALRTNLIAGLVTVLSEKKILTFCQPSARAVLGNSGLRTGDVARASKVIDWIII